MVGVPSKATKTLGRTFEVRCLHFMLMVIGTEILQVLLALVQVKVQSAHPCLVHLLRAVGMVL